MPAVDAPSAGGIAYAELELLIAGLIAAPGCVGIEITVFDPDYDPDGRFARDVADTLVAGLAPLLHAEADTGTGTGLAPVPTQRSARAGAETG
jgi:arginase